MAHAINLLDRVRIASPCMASWADMTGDDRMRFCHQCKLNVYNFSEMTRVEAEQLILAGQGRLCAQYYARADGTIITKDCPIGWRRLKRGLWWSLSSAAAVFTLIATAFGALGSPNRVTRTARLREIAPFNRIADWLDPPPTAVWRGDVAVAPPVPVALTIKGKVATQRTLMGEIRARLARKTIPD